MNDEKKRKLTNRVKRITGQVAGIQRMMDEDKYCVDILMQIAAVRSALDSLGVELLTDHIDSCLVGHGTGSEHHCAQPMTREALLAELETMLARFVK